MSKELQSFDGAWDAGLEPEALAYDAEHINVDVARLAFVMDPPEVRDGALRFTLWIVNDHESAATLAISGFGLQPVHLMGVPYVGPEFGPPGPPVSVRFTLPPRTRTAIKRAFALDQWAFAGVRFDYAWMLQDHSRATLAHGVFHGLQVDPSRGVLVP